MGPDLWLLYTAREILTGFVAGVSELELSVFTPFAYTGGLIWSITFISIGYF